MKLFETQNVDQHVEGTGLSALDAVMEQFCRNGQSFDVGKALDAAIRQCHGMDGKVRSGWDSPFSREQSAIILELLHQFSVQSLILRGVTKPLWFKLIEGKIEKGTRGSAAFDLFATEDVLVGDAPVAVSTGIRTEFHPGLVAIIKEKSGLSVNKTAIVTIPKNETTAIGAVISRNHETQREAVILQGIEVKAGVIDSDYRDEWKVVLRRPIQETTLFDWFEAEQKSKAGFFPTKPEGFQIKKGMKIAQAILVELPTVELIGEGIIIKDETRTGGFGSTGK